MNENPWRDNRLDVKMLMVRTWPAREAFVTGVLPFETHALS